MKPLALAHPFVLSSTNGGFPVQVFNGEKTSLPPELQGLEREIDPKRLAIER